MAMGSKAYIPSTMGAADEVDYESHQCLEGLRPLDASEISVADALTELQKYALVLEKRESIARNLGNELMTPFLCESLDALFGAPPHVDEGPKVSWTKVILAMGPSPKGLDGITSVTIGQSLVKLTETNRKLLSFGRAWRFLYPWPDHQDHKTELGAIDTALLAIEAFRDMTASAFWAAKNVADLLHYRRMKMTAITDSTSPDNVQRVTTGGEDCPEHADASGLLSAEEYGGYSLSVDQVISTGTGQRRLSIHKQGTKATKPRQEVRQQAGPYAQSLLHPGGSSLQAMQLHAGVQKDVPRATDQTEIEPSGTQAPPTPSIGRQSLRSRTSAPRTGDYLDHKPAIATSIDSGQGWNEQDPDGNVFNSAQ
ncbi:hypothetical protein BDV12DRAFT_203389 [Aspergillus spectabilis]